MVKVLQYCVIIFMSMRCELHGCSHIEQNPIVLNFNHHKGPVYHKGLGHSHKPSVSGRFSIRLWAFVSSFVILKEIWSKCCSEIYVKNI